ncbi:M48 family metalloprotease [Pseudoblastomonas halimionae]|uniref:M48 family metalloprotease n=1 Tax=Alteriqipengyuania halimionae TaxID=1926630 RepID=A0A6I4U439_9SPHN|nr:M48 family metalloprotease [Alteriqipengyuania halimionae]MXP10770.1 M48 family metalloprotease [Alteriqipengyuania halimionae]
MRFLHRSLSRLPALLLALAALSVFTARPALAQSILRDAETEAVLHDMAAPLIEAAGLEPDNVEIILVNDPSVNAFVAGGQAVYINSGLISAAGNANEVQGVIAHELGHITGGHILRSGDGIKAASNISILSMLIGLGAALAGAPEAGMAAMQLGQRAAMGKFLAFSRAQESSADAAGAQFLSGAGISGRGSIDFFKRLQNMEFRRGFRRSARGDEEYNRTHPMSGDRISMLREVYTVDPAWDTPSDPELETRFRRMQAKLYGYLASPEDTLRKYPPSMTGDEARVARAYAYHKDALMDRASSEIEALLAKHQDDPYLLEIKGQVLLESGRPEEALAPLRRATEITRSEPLIATIFGHALIATEDKDNFAEAERVLKASVQRDRYNPFGWYQLGVVYAARGDMARARLATAEQQVLSRQMQRALQSAEAALGALPEGSPDWLRAQDIAMQARAALEVEREGR